MIIGILALQGAFFEHKQALEKLGVHSIEVRNKQDLKKCSSLILPGGESTTISQLLEQTCLDKEITKRVKKGMHVFATCAGALVLAKKVIGEKCYKPLKLIDMDISRNAYGRQIDSFETGLDIKGFKKDFHGIFIRAPIIKRTGKKVEVLARFKGKPVLLKQENIMVATFHPELTDDLRLHHYFIAHAHS